MLSNKLLPIALCVWPHFVQHTTRVPISFKPPPGHFLGYCVNMPAYGSLKPEHSPSRCMTNRRPFPRIIPFVNWPWHHIAAPTPFDVNLPGICPANKLCGFPRSNNGGESGWIYCANRHAAHILIQVHPIDITQRVVGEPSSGFGVVIPEAAILKFQRAAV